MIFGIFFIFGLIIGSFLNVVVCRIRKEESILGRSYCPKCKKKIAWYDNIPVFSFLFLQGKCRKCHKKISWQYPAVELLTGFLFAFLGFHFLVSLDAQTLIKTFFYLVFASFFVVILVYDFLYLEIPDAALWPAIFLAVVFNLYLGATEIKTVDNFLKDPVYSAVLAATVSFAFFFSLSYFSKEKWMGMGDAFLVILLGLILGWPEMLLGLFLAFAVGAMYGIILIVADKKKMKSQVPFAPFLIFGSFVSLLFSKPIFDFYFSLFY